MCVCVCVTYVCIWHVLCTWHVWVHACMRVCVCDSSHHGAPVTLYLVQGLFKDLETPLPARGVLGHTAPELLQLHQGEGLEALQGYRGDDLASIPYLTFLVPALLINSSTAEMEVSMKQETCLKRLG